MFGIWSWQLCPRKAKMSALLIAAATYLEHNTDRLFELQNAIQRQCQQHFMQMH